MTMKFYFFSESKLIKKAVNVLHFNFGKNKYQKDTQIHNVKSVKLSKHLKLNN